MNFGSGVPPNYRFQTPGARKQLLISNPTEIYQSLTASLYELYIWQSLTDISLMRIYAEVHERIRPIRYRVLETQKRKTSRCMDITVYDYSKPK